MMRFQIAYATDQGIQKKVNQDSFLAVTARIPSGYAAFVVLCDGMGGLSKGELASAEVIRAFEQWFQERFPTLCQNTIEEAVLHREWKDLIAGLNGKILNYGKRNKVNLGTTATGLLVTEEEYFGFHVGDSRAYEITADAVKQITRDQTLVQREVESGKLTPEQARTDTRRNVLLQCIGASSMVIPEFLSGKRNKEAVYLLCSDGFVHELTDEEMRQALLPEKLADANAMKQAVQELVERVKKRKETDNITAVLLRASYVQTQEEETI